MRLFWWVLAICAAVGVYKLVDAAVSGHFTERQQLHLLGQAIIYGCASLPALAVLFNVVREYRASRDSTVRTIRAKIHLMA